MNPNNHLSPLRLRRFDILDLHDLRRAKFVYDDCFHGSILPTKHAKGTKPEIDFVPFVYFVGNSYSTVTDFARFLG